MAAETSSAAALRAVATAKTLLRQGRLAELVGASPGATPAELRAACKRAQLKSHPDKGGDAELFRLVRHAVEQITQDLRIREDQRIREREQENLERSYRESDARGVRAVNRRRARRPPTRFPTLPRVGVEPGIRHQFRRLQDEHRRLNQAKSRLAKRGASTTEVDAQLAELLAKARAVVDNVVTGGFQPPPRFPYVTKSHPFYEQVTAQLDPLRQALRRLRDRIRQTNMPRRGELEEEAAAIVRQAWDIVASMTTRSDGAGTGRDLGSDSVVTFADPN